MRIPQFLQPFHNPAYLVAKLFGREPLALWLAPVEQVKDIVDRLLVIVCIVVFEHGKEFLEGFGVHLLKIKSLELNIKKI